jgi:hypothetical protein
MSPNNNKDRNKENKGAIKPAETKGDSHTKGSAFNEKPPGRHSETDFSETKADQSVGGEKDILSGSDRKIGPQQDADV